MVGAVNWDVEKARRYNMVKGRIAEALVEELFQAIGFKVYRFGMENTMPEIRGQLNGSKAKITTLIRTMPDFVVQAPGRDPFFVEVKFRADGHLGIERLKRDFPYEDVLFVLVSKRHIKAITYAQLKAGECIEPNDRRYLGAMPEFAEYREQIISFCEFATSFFHGVPDSRHEEASGDEEHAQPARQYGRRQAFG